MKYSPKQLAEQYEAKTAETSALKLSAANITVLDELQDSSLDIQNLDLTIFPNIEKIVLRDGSVIPSGIALLKRLNTLVIDHCRDAVEIPEWIATLEGLETLIINNLYDVEKLPSKLFENTKLKRLTLVGVESFIDKVKWDHMTSLEELRVAQYVTDGGIQKTIDPSISHLKKLKLLTTNNFVDHWQPHLDLPKDFSGGFDNLACLNASEFLEWFLRLPKIKELTVETLDDDRIGDPSNAKDTDSFGFCVEEHALEIKQCQEYEQKIKAWLPSIRQLVVLRIGTYKNKSNYKCGFINSAIPLMESLEELRIDRVELDKETTDIFSTNLSGALRELKNLRCLELKNFYLHREIDGFACLPLLERIEAPGIAVPAKLSYSKTLKFLHANGGNFPFREGFFTTLEFLHLEISIKTIGELTSWLGGLLSFIEVGGLPNLKELKIDYTDLAGSNLYDWGEDSEKLDKISKSTTDGFKKALESIKPDCSIEI